MICKDANKVMNTWIDGELSPDKRAVFEHHLTSCRTCSAKAEDLRRLTAFLGNCPSARPSSGLKKRTLALFIKEAGPGEVVYWWKGLGWGMHAAMMASVLIGLEIGYKLGADWIGVQQVGQYSIFGFLFSAGGLLSSWA